ncbi:MAG: hypothetical protein RKR03_00910 [Candidatus Competibacter sp.]|nr:hypothetical protein [Candidatus Competibacter sp.]
MEKTPSAASTTLIFHPVGQHPGRFPKWAEADEKVEGGINPVDVLKNSACSTLNIPA